MLGLPRCKSCESSSPPREDDFEWFDEEDLEALTAAVNEGELEFLAQPPSKRVHHLEDIGMHYALTLAEWYRERDWILTRILWLTGLEPGRNRGGNLDTLRRFIYIHGCPDTEPMGQPRSHGCIRMRNRDLIELFDRVPTGTSVEIR